MLETTLRKSIPISGLILLALILAACGGGSPAPTAVPAATIPPTGDFSVSIITSAAPTVAGASATGQSDLPSGSLILTQLNKPLAQTPQGQIFYLTNDRFDKRGSPNGRYGVAFAKGANNTNAISVIDYSKQPILTKEIPQGKGLYNPNITWKSDSSGFAFFDFPPANKVASSVRTIFYYDVASGQTKTLVDGTGSTTTLPKSREFSPDGKYLIYAIDNANAEGPGGPDSQTILLNLATNEKKQLSPESAFFDIWLADSSGYLIAKPDQKNVNQISLISITDPTPKLITPPGFSDSLVSVSPDKKRLILTSSPTGEKLQPNNIYMMNLDGSSRKQLTKFTDADQFVTGLIWANDGSIYYSVSASNKDTIWRMDLDGSNQKQITTGTLYAMITGTGN